MGVSANQSDVPRARLPWPLLGHAVGIMRDPISFQQAGHNRYGPIFRARVFAEELYFIDPVGAPDLFAQVVRAPPDELSMIDAYRQLLGRIIGPELFIEVDQQLRHGLSLKFIRQHISATAKFVPQQLQRHIVDDTGELDGLQLANDFVFHVAAHYVLGPEATQRCGRRLAQLMHTLESDFSVLGVMLPITTPSARRRVAAFQELVDTTEQEVRRRIVNAGEQGDFLDYAVANMARPQADSERDVHVLALRTLGVIFGAHTNTAMAIASTLEYLLCHPRFMARVRAEVDALDHNETLDFSRLRSLGEVHRAINETLRLRSTGGIWRKTRTPLELGGYRLPTGSLIGASMGLVNLNRKRYPSPTVYNPDRYHDLVVDGFHSPSVTASPLQFGAFGSGRGLCSGRPLAYTMIALMLIELVRQFDWELRERPKRWFHVLTGGHGRPIGRLRLAYRRRASRRDGARPGV